MRASAQQRRDLEQTRSMASKQKSPRTAEQKHVKTLLAARVASSAERFACKRLCIFFVLGMMGALRSGARDILKNGVRHPLRCVLRDALPLSKHYGSGVVCVFHIQF
jgi:hypothetical protein